MKISRLFVAISVVLCVCLGVLSCKKEAPVLQVLLFWVPPPGRLHPPVFQMLGGNEFRLRRGFACGKTLVRRTRAAGQKAGWVVPYRVSAS